VASYRLNFTVTLIHIYFFVFHILASELIVSFEELNTKEEMLKANQLDTPQAGAQHGP
jgi:hypothetical protein